MVDTAGSLCNAAKAIVEIGGATEVYACATHGVLSGPALERHGKQLHQGADAASTPSRAPENAPKQDHAIIDVAPDLCRRDPENLRRDLDVRSVLICFFRPTLPRHWLIAGLGNPGREYEKTRHNTGFLALDLLAKALGVRVNKPKFKGEVGVCDYKGKRLILVKPQTYMNASGLCIEPCAHFYKIPPERIIVIFDDISLPVGRIRVRKNGSAGGHNRDQVDHLESRNRCVSACEGRRGRQAAPGL